MRAHVEPFFHAATGSWSDVVSDGAGGPAAIVDPVLDYDAASGRTETGHALRIAAYVERAGLRVDWILETHVHADHLSSAQYLKERFGARLGIGAGVRMVQENVRRLFNLDSGFRADGSQFDHLFADGETFALGALRGRVLATPGHTSDSVTYVIGDAAFIGDTLFAPDGGTARCDFPGGSARALHASVRVLYALPADTRLFLCHDYPEGAREPRCETSIAEQKAGNIHLRADTTLDEFVRMREARDATLALPRLIFPSIQVNVRAGALPAPEANGVSYLKIPVNAPLRA